MRILLVRQQLTFNNFAKTRDQHDVVTRALLWRGSAEISKVQGGAAAALTIEVAVSAFIQQQNRDEQNAKDRDIINRRADYLKRRGRGRS